MKAGSNISSLSSDRFRQSVNTVINGNALDVLQTFPDASIDCVVTSPPYWQLRHYEGIPDYVWDGDKDCQHDFDSVSVHCDNLRYRGDSSKTGNSSNKAIFTGAEKQQGHCSKCGAWKGQLGLEPTFEMYLNHLWQIMDELHRVLKPTGTAWINLGDTYNSHSLGNKSGGSFQGKSIEKNNHFPRWRTPPRNIPDKCQLLLPHRFAIGCIERGWVVRNDVIWAKPNGMPESVKDRFSKRHEYIFFLVKHKRYYFDMDSIRDPHKPQSVKRAARARKSDKLDAGQYGVSFKQGNVGYDDLNGKLKRGELRCVHSKGKNPGDVSDFWAVSTRPSFSKHFATFNTDLISKPILAGCPEKVCSQCGKPPLPVRNNEANTGCGCNTGFEPGIVLDPFCGTGTTLIRALELNRQVIGIDGSGDYTGIAKNLLTDKIKNHETES
ncbi:MAG: site-specific DNA-methyltransferase [Flavobacteriales bacterium]|nr:site-specific DNA-methyltransferase [Flavobacteriales bacterium]